MLHRMKLEQPVVWAYVTDGGALWSEAPMTQRISS
jgi:hypothetical protein